MNTARTVVLILALAVTLGAAALTQEFVSEANDYQRLEHPVGVWVIALRLTALAVAAASALVVLLRWRRLSAIPVERVGPALRMCAYLVLLAVTTASLVRAAQDPEVVRHALRSSFWSALLLGESIWLVCLALAPARFFRAPRGVAGWLDVVLLNCLIILILLDLGLLAYGRLSPTPLLSDEGKIQAYIEGKKLSPETSYFGFHANSSGFHDEEFFAAEGDDVVVALLADSFGTGAVPYDYNFATVAERILRERLGDGARRVAIHNLGVGGIGMSGYAWLLEHEVPALEPSLVVLALFVGNDLGGFKKYKTRFHSFQDLRVYSVIRKLVLLRRETAAGGRIANVGLAEPEIPDYVLDPELEPPTMSAERFLSVELERMERCIPDHPRMLRHYERFFAALDTIQERVGEDLVVVLIPDEYQVNDALYAQLLEAAPPGNRYERELPQQRVLEHCRLRNLECLDLLPPLRRAQAEGHVYHLRDTHWNASGNRVAGEILGEHLSERLAPQP